MVLVNSQKMFLSQGQIVEGPKKHTEKRSYLNTYKPGRPLHCGQNKDLLSSIQLFWNLIVRTTYETNRPKLLISLFLTPTAGLKKKIFYDIYMTISEISIILLL